MKKQILILLVFNMFIILQAAAQYNKTEEIADFNNDKVMDTLRSQYNGGSTFGGVYVKIIDGKTNEIFELNNDGCSCQMIYYINVPEKLLLPQNKYFYNVLKEQLLPKKQNKPDASLQWILNGLKTNKELIDNPYFSLIIDPEPKWERMKKTLPKSYFLPISKKTLHTLYQGNEYFFERINDYSKILLTYYASSLSKHDTLSKLPIAASSKKYEIYNLSHAVLAKKGKKSKWLFITEPNLTDAPEKLRWQSIRKTTLIDKYIIVQQDVPPSDRYNIYIINIETGITGKLKFDTSNSHNYCKDNLGIYLIEGDAIILNKGCDNQEKTIKLQFIFDELEKQHLSK